MKTCESCGSKLPENPYRDPPFRMAAPAPVVEEPMPAREPIDIGPVLTCLSSVACFFYQLAVGALFLGALVGVGLLAWWIIKVVVFKGIYHVGYYVGTSWLGWEMYASGSGSFWTWLFGLVCLVVPFALARLGESILED